jgi:hypothetical protein
VIYDNIPIVIESQDEPGTVQFKLNTDEFSGFFEGGIIGEVWMQYKSIGDGDLTCMSNIMVPFSSAASETFSAKCVRGMVTVVQLWVADSGLSGADNAEVDHCCRKPSEFLPQSPQPPAVQYTFVLHCESLCDPHVCGNFAVHARDTITFAGAANTMIYGGDVGVAPGTSITGNFDVVDGETFTGTSNLDFAASVLVAYNEAMAVTGATFLPTEIGGLTLTPGTYRAPAEINLQSGFVTLDGGGNENAEFLIQAGSHLTTAANTYVKLINGAKAENVMWALGTDATLGANSVIEGSILTGKAITFGTKSELHGCALAQSAVTFDSDGLVKGVYYIDGAVDRTRHFRG